MPELPEVETVANGVNARVRGQRIVRVWTSGKPQTFKSPEEEIAEALTGATIERVRRVGKSIVFDLTRAKKPAPQFLVHLGMTGRLLVSQPDVPLPAHTHAVLTLADKREIRFVDPRRFGRLSVVPLERQGRRRLHRPGQGADDHLRRRVCGAVPRAQACDQGGSAESVDPARRGQHLRGREPVSRRHPSAPSRGPTDAR